MNKKAIAEQLVKLPEELTHNASLEKVMQSLPEIADEQDKKMIEANVKQLIALGVKLEDIIAYMKCHEEVNPELDEAIALRRMKAIADKYPGLYAFGSFENLDKPNIA